MGVTVTYHHHRNKIIKYTYDEILTWCIGFSILLSQTKIFNVTSRY